MSTQPCPYSGDNDGGKHRPEHHMDGYREREQEPQDWLEVINTPGFTPEAARRAFFRGPKFRSGLSIVLIPASSQDTN